MSVTTDSLYMVFNEYEVDKKSGIKDINLSANYNSEYSEGYTLEEVQQLYADDVIYQIDRD